VPVGQTTRADDAVIIAPYDSSWPARFSAEQGLLEEAIGASATGGIHHVGSTAVPGLAAKPVIDILVGVRDLSSSRACFGPLAELQYKYSPYRVEEMHWFCKPDPTHRTHHLHLVPCDSPRYRAELTFRDLLRGRSDLAAEYAELKNGLAERFRHDRDGYTRARTVFIERTLRKAPEAQELIPSQNVGVDGFADLPAFVAWRHRDARDGFEVVFFSAHGGRTRIEGYTSAIESGEPFAVSYAIEVDERGWTRAAEISERSRGGTRNVVLQTSGDGTWVVDGRVVPLLDGCYDVDLEASAMTNALPIRRLGLHPGDSAQVPAAYVRSPGLAVERLEQGYRREGSQQEHRYAYSAPVFDFQCEFVYDSSGLLVDYPGIAARASGA
jgi:GrpB-like predicted nucleotidyltransferase (UPF0157 family)